MKTQSMLNFSTMRMAVVAACVGTALLLGGCANKSASGGVYTYDQAQREQIVRLGTVTNLRPITIQSGQSSGVGGVAGAALGGVAGSAIGGGRGSVLAAIGGALIGGLVGNKVENEVDKTRGVEVTVQLDNGETRVVAQADDTPFSVGQRVRLISGSGPTRVAPM
ncbi:glycine zipper 2TM domain-containing protein [Alcaligenes endophyticus]|uniref:Glycine zipper 2TM domain-containing protein n=1 Tax=Alcaligenes endophyticus TaxID=1929088 RepID=A0ABT8EMM6_9BURK|nr:glycine zipper 2TM domain-containing protein [Alcaligenes endophyticus]MCX5591077.1 glycine zipper 2TM domain-containing protein [Alcaligenes endophyticus]MDN4122345.1 glycine zipper 2TM domain-containing protein [Alcaligenes endophyticus]